MNVVQALVHPVADDLGDEHRHEHGKAVGQVACGLDTDGDQGLRQADGSCQLSAGPNQGILAEIAPIGVGEEVVQHHADEPPPGRPDEQGWDEEAAGDEHAVGPASEEEVQDAEHDDGRKVVSSRLVMEQGSHGFFWSLVP